MADLKISELSAVIPSDLTSNDLLVIVNNGDTKNIELSTLLAASSAFYVPYIANNIVPITNAVLVSFPIWNATYSVVSSLSSQWNSHLINNNLIIGSQTPLSSTSGFSNTIIGEKSLLNATIASGNVAIGFQTLFSNTSGSGNTAIGYNAGYANVVGTNNTYIGNQATGYCADESNTITLGNGAIKTLRCQANTITSLSDQRDKTNVKDLNSSLAFVNALNPVNFTWNTRDGKKTNEEDIGFLAQQLLEAQKKTNFYVPNLVNEQNPEILEASYGKLLPILVKAIQDLTLEIELLKKR